MKNDVIGALSYKGISDAQVNEINDMVKNIGTKYGVDITITDAANAQTAIRNIEIVEMNKNGHSYTEIADRFNISKARVASVIHRYKTIEYLETSNEPDAIMYRLLGKDSRSYHALRRVGVTDIDGIAELIESFNNDTEMQFLNNIRGIGNKTAEHIRQCYKDYLTNKGGK